MDVGRTLARCESRSWPTARPTVSVVVATHNRAHYLPGLLDALAAQTADIEVVIVDDGSTDGTWQWLEQAVSGTALPVRALRLAHTGGPSVPRNTGVEQARADVLAVTDDDCLPDPGWAAAIRTALAAGASVAQGATRPAPAHHAPWDRSVHVARPSGLYETCNLGFPRAVFVELGGFPTYDVLAHLPRGFGEDVVLGARAARDGGFAWAPDATVVHRWVPTTYREHLDGVRRLTGFPWLAREVPEVADLLRGGVFLSRRTIEYDAALAAAVLAALTRRPALLVAATPWLTSRVHAARGREGRSFAVRLAQEAVADSVGFAALVRGSLRHRRVVI